MKRLLLLLVLVGISFTAVAQCAPPGYRVEEVWKPGYWDRVRVITYYEVDPWTGDYFYRWEWRSVWVPGRWVIRYVPTTRTRVFRSVIGGRN